MNGWRDPGLGRPETQHQQAAVERPAVTIRHTVKPTPDCDHLVVIRDSEKDWWRCSSCDQVELCHDVGLDFDCEGGPHNSSDGNRRCSAHEALQ